MTPPTPHPIDPALERQLSEIYLRVRQGRFDEAAACLLEAKRIAPDAPAVIELEGDLAFAQNRFKQAELLYKRAFDADPGNAKLEEKYATAVIRVHAPQFVTAARDEDDGFLTCLVKRPLWAPPILSAVFPGVGQWYQGDFLKAIIILGVYLTLLFNEFYAGMTILRSYKGTADYSFGNFIGQMLGGWSALAILLMTAIWIYGVVDAYLVSKKLQ